MMRQSLTWLAMVVVTVIMPQAQSEPMAPGGGCNRQIHT
jgi:hypothetical protein